MAKNWSGIIGGKAAAWTIPQDAVTEFNALVQAAESALETAQNEATRTAVTTVHCKLTFKALSEKMRDVKRRYFLEPPLTDEDIVSLGLKLHDGTPTHSGPPTAQVQVETFLVGRHELGVKIIYATGSPHDPSNKGYRVWYTVCGSGDTPPENPPDLRESFYTKRKKDVMEFGTADSGKTAYFAVQVENEGKKGPWGPVTSALIP
jgi:hypothetical protein